MPTINLKQIPDVNKQAYEDILKATISRKQKQHFTFSLRFNDGRITEYTESESYEYNSLLQQITQSTKTGQSVEI